MNNASSNCVCVCYSFSEAQSGIYEPNLWIGFSWLLELYSELQCNIRDYNRLRDGIRDYKTVQLLLPETVLSCNVLFPITNSSYKLPMPIHFVCE